MNLANFMRTHLYASLATLKIGCDILFKEEKVKVDTLYAQDVYKRQTSADGKSASGGESQTVDIKIEAEDDKEESVN